MAGFCRPVKITAKLCSFVSSRNPSDFGGFSAGCSSVCSGQCRSAISLQHQQGHSSQLPHLPPQMKKKALQPVLLHCEAERPLLRLLEVPAVLHPHCSAALPTRCEVLPTVGAHPHLRCLTHPCSPHQMPGQGRDGAG